MDAREWRRRRAVALDAEGWTQQRIATALGVTQGAVCGWLQRYRDHGAAGLAPHPPPGRVSKLTAAQRAELPALLNKGAEAYGFVGAVWTTPRVATVIARTFGVSYHPATVGRLLHALGWSPQLPVVRAVQRDEAAIATWRDERHPELEKKSRRRRADGGVRR